MRLASRTFRPPLWATCGLVVAVVLFCTAGFWQLDRAEQKRRLFQEFDASGHAVVLTEPVADDEVAAATFRPLRLTGRYDTGHQFLLDMMVLRGRVGYHVLTPLLRDDGVAVLVNRGWIAADADRERLPDLAVGAGGRTVAGLIAPLPRAGMTLESGAANTVAPWPRRLTFPSAADVRAHLDYPVAGHQLLLDPMADDGYAREWRPELLGPDGHLGYAVQWFGLAIALFIIYVVGNLKKTDEGAAGDRAG